MLFKLFSAMAQKRWTAATDHTPPPARTLTPIADMTQRSAINISPIPVILAQGAKSLLKPLPEHHVIIAIGRLAYGGLGFFRVYLSQGDGAFLHLAVGADGKTLLECRLYQPYHEVVPLWASLDAQKRGMLPGNALDESLNWEFWLRDDPNPQIGGMIGCPSMPGKNEDGAILYQRSLASGMLGQRIAPLTASETLLDIEGHGTKLQHSLMGYGRALNETVNEYLLVAAVESPAGASVNMWLGIDIDHTDLTLYPAP